MKNSLITGVAAALFTASILISVRAQAASHAHFRHRAHILMVGYDAKDRKYYSVAYAKAHGMHDRGGDPLTIVPMSSLPKDAKMSHAMLGKM